MFGLFNKNSGKQLSNLGFDVVNVAGGVGSYAVSKRK